LLVFEYLLLKVSYIFQLNSLTPYFGVGPLEVHKQVYGLTIISARTFYAKKSELIFQ
jgi:hypothetical protein